MTLDEVVQLQGDANVADNPVEEDGNVVVEGNAQPPHQIAKYKPPSPPNNAPPQIMPPPK